MWSSIADQAIDSDTFEIWYRGPCSTINIITYKLYKLDRKSTVIVAQITSHSTITLLRITGISYTITSLQLLEDLYISISNKCLGESQFLKITADIIHAELWIKLETNPDQIYMMYPAPTSGRVNQSKHTLCIPLTEKGPGRVKCDPIILIYKISYIKITTSKFVGQISFYFNNHLYTRGYILMT